jgi:hypothetical protein
MFRKTSGIYAVVQRNDPSSLPYYLDVLPEGREWRSHIYVRLHVNVLIHNEKFHPNLGKCLAPIDIGYSLWIKQISDDRSQSSSVNIAISLRVERPRSRGSIPCRDKRFLSSQCQDRHWGSLGFPGAVFSAIKLQGREADHSSPPPAEVNNGGAILPLYHISLLCVA